MQSGAEVIDVGRPKRVDPKVARPKRPAPVPEPDEPGRVGILNLKGSEEFRAWLERFHRATYIPKLKMVRLGLALLAAEQGFEPPPEI